MQTPQQDQLRRFLAEPWRRIGAPTFLALFLVAPGATQEPVVIKPFEVTPDGVVERPTGGRESDLAAEPEVSRERILERMRWTCESSILRSEVTLFANGTLRLRQAKGKDLEERSMWLRELKPEEIDGYVNRLSEPSRDETPTHSSTVSGAWLADCTLRLDLPQRDPEVFRFGSRDVLTLDLERTVAVARELEALFADDQHPPEGARQLPYDYVAQRGDVLQRHDGVLFEVQGFTSDGTGVELLGIDHPLTIYLPADQIKEQFYALVPRWFRDR
jgi:hypothetical protein